MNQRYLKGHDLPPKLDAKLLKQEGSVAILQ
jgi:hypothetical protein